MGAFSAFREELKQTSVLYRTGQGWKMWIPILLQLLLFVPFFLLGPAGRDFAVIGWVVSFTFQCLALRCPDCGARWYWHAVSTKEGGIRKMFKHSACPMCGSACSGIKATSDVS